MGRAVPISVNAARRSIAVHEAGHAVAGWYAASRGYDEQRFVRVWLRRGTDTGTEGRLAGAVDRTLMGASNDPNLSVPNTLKLSSDCQVRYLRCAEADLLVS